jgi:hypothetical protein
MAHTAATASCHVYGADAVKARAFCRSEMGGRGGARNSIVKFRILMIDAVLGSQKATLPDIPATVLQPQTSQARMQ